MSITQVPVSGTVKHADGTVAAGATVTFTLAAAITDGDIVISTEPIVATCDATGSFTQDLYATDDPSTTPTGSYYTVSISPAGKPWVIVSSFKVAIPHADSTGVDLLALAQLSNPLVATPYVSELVAGTGITLSPTEGTGQVTISSAGGAAVGSRVSGASDSVVLATDASGNLANGPALSSVVSDTRLASATAGQVAVKNADGGWAPGSAGAAAVGSVVGGSPVGARLLTIDPTSKDLLEGPAYAINVCDPKYGAKGDGVTDDTAAIQAAITAAGVQAVATGGMADVVFPSGYKFYHGQINLAANIRLWLYSAVITPKLPFSGALFKYPLNSTPAQCLLEVRGGYFVGTAAESSTSQNAIVGSGGGTQFVDLTIRDTHVTNWGCPAWAPINNVTRVRFLNNTIICNEITNTTTFQNTVSFDYTGGVAASGEILVDGNFIHNATADAIAVVVTGGTANVPTALNFTVTNNIITADPPIADTNCTFNGTTLVEDANASTANVGKFVSFPGWPIWTYILSADDGVSYTLSNPSSYSGSGTLYIGVYRNTIVLEIDTGAGNSSVPFTNVLFANNQVTSYERACMSISGANRSVQQGLIKGNILYNGQLNAALASSAMGNCLTLTGNQTHDICVEDNYMIAASGVGPIGGGASNTGRQAGNKFTTGPCQGTATLAAGAVTISTAEIQAGDAVLLARQSPAGALGELSVGSIQPGISPPAAPVPTTASTGGTIAAGTYTVAVTYLDSYGETLASSSGTVTTTGTTSTITIPSAPAETNATGWYAYVSQAGGTTLHLQQTAGSPTAIGTSLTLTAPPTNTGASPPTSDTSGGFSINSTSATDTSTVFWEIRH